MARDSVDVTDASQVYRPACGEIPRMRQGANGFPMHAFLQLGETLILMSGHGGLVQFSELRSLAKNAIVVARQI